ncbi:MAG: sulfatase [Verrucomicrobiales bacterium]|nr:sulfatase [Verrucomicrobiales bacterium]
MTPPACLVQLTRRLTTFPRRLLASALLLAHLASTAAPPPNIVLILADDLGWSDLACYGADLHQTPHLDRLARESVRFTQAYAMPVCSPTRAALLTGQHAARLQFTIWREGALNRDADAAKNGWKLLPPRTQTDLPVAETSLARLLRQRGYATLHVGKWHLGDADHAPQTHGFDVNVGGTHWGAPESYFWPFSGHHTFQEFRYVPGLGLGHPGEYLTDRLTDEALRLIDEVRDQPFFLNLWYHSPHTPIDGKSNLVAHFQARLKPGLHHQNPGYAAMIASLDENVGRVLRHLDRRRLSRQTLVVFASDNGGTTNLSRGRKVTDNYPLRSGKGSLYEGGIRVPLLIRYPGITPQGAVCHTPVLCTDLFTTLAEAAGAPTETGLDGLSLLPLLKDPTSPLPRESLFFHYPHYYPTTTPVSAVRQGDWKLLEYFEDQHVELYDLAHDPSESRDLASEMPDRAAQLRTRLQAWRHEVGAGLPTPR